MILNHARQTVSNWNSQGQGESFCPDCRDPLVAHRGDYVVWHWQHLPSTGSRDRLCLTDESEWHLAWKSAHLGLPGWEIEVPLLNGRYRIDAMNVEKAMAREFVHSLSDRYEEKHRTLSLIPGLDLLWILDGAEFASTRRHPVHGRTGSGLKKLLKPRALDVHQAIGGAVHLGGVLWRHWKRDLWYPVRGHDVDSMLKEFDFASGLIKRDQAAETAITTELQRKGAISEDHDESMANARTIRRSKKITMDADGFRTVVVQCCRAPRQIGSSTSRRYAYDCLLFAEDGMTQFRAAGKPREATGFFRVDFDDFRFSEFIYAWFPEFRDNGGNFEPAFMVGRECVAKVRYDGHELRIVHVEEFRQDKSAGSAK